MSRRRWVWSDELKELVEVSPDWTDKQRRAPVSTEALTYSGLRATDGTDLSSKRKHAQYMCEKGLTLASDFKESWSAESIAKHRAAQERAEAADRRSDLIETYKQLNEAKRRR